MLPDDIRDFGGSIGKLRTFSIAHLLAQNPFDIAASDERLSKQLKEESEYTKQADSSLSKLLSALSKGVLFPDEVDQENIRAAIQKGNGIGLSGAPDGYRSANLLWAGAARWLEQKGIDHLNDLAPTPQS